MISPTKITPKKLSKQLVKKHKDLLKNYDREQGLLNRIFILEEKKDQLEHWVNTSDEDELKSGNIMKQKSSVDKELSELRDEYEKNRGLLNKVNAKKGRSELESVIKKHEEALEHWKNKNREYAKKKT
ncbi:MAG: hypothetical protein B6U72_04590 [Candidatus Altiarchaeales archaeon ex4484_2]|nr:MAG: hypothetical protein B6U72_04590 [Candidatus Altiarchaeales archaeon ex4484_2]